MPTPSAKIIALLDRFGGHFSKPTYKRALVLLYGVILAPGRRTVASALRVMGLGESPSFGSFHRVLSRARWSPMALSRQLLSLLVEQFVGEHEPLVFLVDDTPERRCGPKIKWRSWIRDPVRSTSTRVAYCLGIRWLCVALLVKVPWSRRPWALPVLIMPAPTEQISKKLGRRHRTMIDRTMLLVRKLRAWLPGRRIVLVGDGGFAAVKLVALCQRLAMPVTLISRLRLDAVLHDPPGPQPKSKRGPKPKKGARQTKLADRLQDPKTVWQSIFVPWYGGQLKTLQITTGCALWHRGGHDPVPIRWVMLRCPDDPKFKPMALFCSDQSATAWSIIAWFVSRWNIEVTFEDLRANLGFETQRHWSQPAVERTTPCLFGCFSLVVLIAATLHPERLPLHPVQWYPKTDAAFSDALAAVRQHLWLHWNYEESASDPPPLQFPPTVSQHLLHALCYVA